MLLPRSHSRDTVHAYRFRPVHGDAAGCSRSATPASCLALILTSQLMVVLDATIVNIALHDIKNALRLLPDRPVLGGQRLHPDLRRPAAARRPRR